MSTTTVIEDVRPVAETLNDLLAGLGLFVDTDGPELTIDRFDLWTNPQGMTMACYTTTRALSDVLV
jgi:hypothetical protein